MQIRCNTHMFLLLWIATISSANIVVAQQGREITNAIGMKLVLIPKGKFLMGSPIEEKGRGRHNEMPQHQVTISKDYYLGAFEVTQAQYEKVMGTNPSGYQGDFVKSDNSNHPVENVTWDDALEFCMRLSELPEEQKAGRVYRLPTEAEWEYACRANTKTAYCFGDDEAKIGDYAWFQHNTGLNDIHTRPVGQKKPNAWGLYDMHGNVWEWCSDWHGDYSKEAVIDPNGPSEGDIRVLRGGSWRTSKGDLRSANRMGRTPTHPTYDQGFRVALSASEASK